MRLSPHLAALLLVGCSKPQTDSNNPTPATTAATAPTATTAAVQSAPSTSAPAPTPRAACDGVFDAPPGAVKLCDEHVLADKSEIHWTSWSVTTSRMETFEPYRKRAGECKMGFTFKPPILSVSNNADMRLSIHDVTETGFPSCSTKPGAEARSVIVISQKRDKP